MMRHRLELAALMLTLALSANGCGNAAAESDNKTTAETTVESSAETENTGESAATDPDMFSDRDQDPSYDESEAVEITLNGDAVSSDSNAVSYDDGTLTITKEGVYVLSGELTDGMIVVEVDKTEKVQLVLNGVSINNESGAAIYVKQADKVFITLAEGTENVLTNGNGFLTIDENNIDGVIFAKDDITLNGSGSLTVTSPSGNGIVCKDDLKITNGTYVITANQHGLDANDSIRIKDADLTIESGEDGLHADNSEDETEGFVYIESGNFTITAGDDGIHASETLTVIDGIININECYEGLEGLHVNVYGGEITLKASDDGFNAAGGNDQSGFGGTGGDHFGGGFGRNSGSRENQNEQTDTSGAAEADASDSGDTPGILIAGGKIRITAYGDGLDANGTIEINGGDTVVSGPTQGDTATLDYDASGTISGGTFIGTGASGMAQTLTGDGQGVISVNVGSADADSEITLTDKDGNVVLSYIPDLSMNVVILSSPDIVKGEAYTLTVGEATSEFTAQ